jgi:hypothetical protein
MDSSDGHASNLGASSMFLLYRLLNSVNVIAEAKLCLCFDVKFFLYLMCVNQHQSKNKKRFRGSAVTLAGNLALLHNRLRVRTFEFEYYDYQFLKLYVS